MGKYGDKLKALLAQDKPKAAIKPKAAKVYDVVTDADISRYKSVSWILTPDNRLVRFEGDCPKAEVVPMRLKRKQVDTRDGLIAVARFVPAKIPERYVYTTYYTKPDYSDGTLDRHLKRVITTHGKGTK